MGDGERTGKMTLDPELVRERLRGFAEFNEWERAYKRELLHSLSLDEKWRQFEDICAFVLKLAPKEHERLVKARLHQLAQLRRYTERMEAWRQRENLR